MTYEVVVESEYPNKRSVPVVGQRKMMRVNGKLETLTLQELHVTRKHTWDDETGNKKIFYFKAQETWRPWSDSEGA